MSMRPRRCVDRRPFFPARRFSAISARLILQLIFAAIGAGVGSVLQPLLAMDHPIAVTFIRLIVALPLVGAAINFIAGALAAEDIRQARDQLRWMRRRHRGVHPCGARVRRDDRDPAGKPLHARRPVEVVRRRRTEPGHRVLARSVVDGDDADSHRRRRPDPHLLDRLHARRRRLLAFFRMAQPVHVRDAGAGVGRQPVADVRGLGRRGAVLVRADRVLVQGARRTRRRATRRSSSTGSATWRS